MARRRSGETGSRSTTSKETLLTYWGTQGSFPGAISNPHAFSVDSDGNLYVVDYLNNRLQKFTPKREAEPSRLMVQPPR